MHQEEIRSKFSSACRDNDDATIAVMLKENFYEHNKFLNFVFEQGVMLAVMGSNTVVLKRLLECDNYVVSPMTYATLFSQQDTKSNLEILECLATRLPDLDELQNLVDYESFVNKDKFIDIYQSRIEKIALEKGVAQASKTGVMKL